MKKNIKLLVPALCVAFALSCGGAGTTQKTTSSEKSAATETVQTETQSAVSSEDLAAACFDGDVATVQFYINQGVDVNAVDEGGFTYLMYAAFNGHLNIVSLLLDRGAVVDMVNLEGRSALMFAATSESTSTVKVLLDAGADVNMVDKEEHFSPLMFAATEGQEQTVRLLLARGANPNLKDVDGDTAMSFAAQNNHFHVVAVLKDLTK